MGCGLSKAHIHPEVLVSHGSARLTVHGRRLIVERHQQGWRQAHIAAAMGVSRKCVKTWIDRYATEGDRGLADRSSRPHSMPTRTSETVEATVTALRAERRVGRDQIAHELGLAPRTVSRILRRQGVPRPAECDPMTGAVIRASRATTRRYEHPYAGSLVRGDAAHRKSPGLLSECPHPVAVLRLADGGAGGGVDEVGDRDGFGAVGAGPAEADAGAGLVAVVAPLLSVVAGLAAGAGVDRDVAAADLLGDSGFGREGGAGVPA